MENMIRWYPFLVENGDDSRNCLLGHENVVPNKHFIVARDVKSYKNFARFESYFDFFTWMGKNVPNVSERFFYETVISGCHVKPFFDIDYSCDGQFNETEMDDFASLVGKCAVEYSGVKNAEALIFSSHEKHAINPIKFSYHVVINGVRLNSIKEAKIFYTNLISNLPCKKELINTIDESVYKSTQQFRIIGCRKFGVGDERVKVFRPDLSITTSYYTTPILTISSLITNVAGCYYPPIKSKCYTDLQTQSTLTTKTFEQHPDCCELESEEALRALQDNIGFENAPFKIRGIIGNMILLGRTQISFCPICERKHEHENPFMVLTDYKSSDNKHNKIVKLYCRRNSENKHIDVTFLSSSASPTSPSPEQTTSLCKKVKGRYYVKRRLKVGGCAL